MPWTMRDGPLRSNYCPVVPASFSMTVEKSILGIYLMKKNKIIFTPSNEIRRDKVPEIPIYIY